MAKAIGVIVVTILLLGLYVLALCAAAGKKTPKPGRDFDERGEY